MLTIKNRKRVNNTRKKTKKNVLGKPLTFCNKTKVTGFYRNGYCSTGNNNAGTHVVCAVMDNDFLQYTLKQGNDLITHRPGFPGLKAGDILLKFNGQTIANSGELPRIVSAVKPGSKVPVQVWRDKAILLHAKK